MWEPLAAPARAPAWLQRLNPRARLLAALGLALTVAGLRQPGALILALAFALGLAAAARVRWRALARRLLPLELLLALLAASAMLSLAGEPWLVLGTLELSRPGMELALTLLLRVNAMIIALLGLLGTLAPGELAHALASLRLPRRLVTLMVLTLRQIDLLALESRRLRRAMRARAFIARPNRHGWNSLGWLIGMLLVRALQRAQRLDAAMRCRGFQGHFYHPDPAPWDRHHSLASVALGLLLLALLALEHLGHGL